jgi:ABC-type multidrug transport system fused ATPase/permease subunit
LDSPHDKTALGQQIKTNLDSIVDIAEKWLLRLRRRRKQVKLASAFLTTLLVLAGLAAVSFGYITSQYSLSFFQEHTFLILTLFGVIAVIAILCGVASYFFQGRKQDSKLDELARLISEMKQSDSASTMSYDVLSIAEKILTLLPEVVRKRNQDSFLFGILAFVITILPAKLPLALLIGVLVWLYFRYEMNKGYDKEILRFEEQRKQFEQRKQEFMETL